VAREVAEEPEPEEAKTEVANTLASTREGNTASVKRHEKTDGSDGHADQSQRSHDQNLQADQFGTTRTGAMC
jgi:hypothetical protein